MVGSPRLSYHQGDHVCTLFTTHEEQLQAAAEYIRGGLSRGERCLYVCCERELNEFRAALKQADIDVEHEEARGALVLLTKHDGHLKGGTFDPDLMIEMLAAAVKDTLAQGFKGLCAAGDMNWLLDNAPGSEKLAEYEARLNRFYESNRALGLCLYNLGTMPPNAIDDCLATHPFVRIEGPILLENPFYELPEKAMTRVAKTNDLRPKIERIRSAASGTRQKIAALSSPA
ncbi:MAG TPA: MEDS domain-containing protein [Terriglobales bacterium]|nr:MEDS domain-containing protein [Terriglobales bacterium]